MTMQGRTAADQEGGFAATLHEAGAVQTGAGRQRTGLRVAGALLDHIFDVLPVLILLALATGPARYEIDVANAAPQPTAQSAPGGVLMPVRPENIDRYPVEWPVISWSIRWLRALGRCECRGQCGRPDAHLDVTGRCVNRNGAPALGTESRTVLTVAHLDHTPEHCHPANLRAMCQGCHLRYDRAHHAETRRATRARERIAAGEQPLPICWGSL